MYSFPRSKSFVLSDDQCLQQLFSFAVGVQLVGGYTGGALDGNTHTGESDFFLMKFSADGGWQWTQQRGSDLYDYAQAVQVESFIPAKQHCHR